MKIVICDYDFPDTNPEWEVLKILPQAELVPAHCTTEQEVIELVREADGVINPVESYQFQRYLSYEPLQGHRDLWDRV